MKDVVTTDYIVVGSGIAGLRAAIELATSQREVILLTKDRPTDSNTEVAQGGIAAAMSEDDEIGLHEQDTLAAGDGLCDPSAVRVLVEQGPRFIYELIDWGAQFDQDGLSLAFGREGAHSKRRVLHARGDSTGREIVRALLQKAATFPNIRFRQRTFTASLWLDADRCAGVVALDEDSQRCVPMAARAVLLATGGCGQVFRETSNPPQATGDGMALAHIAGAQMMDMEFIQFHPTALAIPNAPRFLLSEALRGEGAYVRTAGGRRFLQDYDPRGELAPRDIVTRAIVAELGKTGDRCVFLDLTHLGDGDVPSRFPRIYETVLKFGIDLRKDLVPILPAAHYAMGGVRTDLQGRSSIPGLYAAGEVASTAVHGANRLASNSLLEGLVFGAAAAAAMLEEEAARPGRGPASAPAAPIALPPARAKETIDEVRSLAWERIGILRTGKGLASALGRLVERSAASPTEAPMRVGLEALNIVRVATMIARSALLREESRGGHFRLDHPGRDDARWRCHTLLEGDAARKGPAPA